MFPGLCSPQLPAALYSWFQAEQIGIVCACGEVVHSLITPEAQANLSNPESVIKDCSMLGARAGASASGSL